LDLEYIEKSKNSKFKSQKPKVSNQQSAVSIQHPASSIQRLPPPSDKRISVGKMSANALKIMSPGFFAIHPIEVHEPEEDILLLDVSFLSTTPEAMMQVFLLCRLA